MSAIAERAMLVQLSMGGFSGKRMARDVAREVAESRGAESDSLDAVLRLIPPRELKGIEAASRACRDYYCRRTLPWQRRGASILPCKIYFDFTKRMGELLEARRQEVDSFMTRYEESAVHWVTRLGGIAHGETLPTADKVRERFEANVQVWPFPSGNDFRLDMEEGQLAELRKAADDAANVRVAEAVADAVNRLRVVVRRYVDNLGHTEDGRARRITGGMESDLRDLLDVLPAFNLTGSKELDAIVEDAKSLLNAPAESLREDEALRGQVREDAQRIYEKMAAIWG